MSEKVYFTDNNIEPHCKKCEVQMSPEGHCIRCYRYECPKCGHIWYP